MIIDFIMAVDDAVAPPAVGNIEAKLRQLLYNVIERQELATSSTPLAPELLEDGLSQLADELKNVTPDLHIPLVLEAAVRRIFYDLSRVATIDHPEANHIWSFLDILLSLCESRETGRAIIWYLIEELVESQTADLCRIIFDYLDSRRERLTQREFQVTHLIILRTCNELLRRLSKAEDATFCGRVFFFLFQIFPLGEQSSVNLRGEFHTDNVTLFDEGNDAFTPQDQASTPMAIDEGATATGKEAAVTRTSHQEPNGPKATKAGKAAEAEDISTFYSVFWRLQQDFSQPTRLIESEEYFADFISRLEKTVDRFGKTPVVKTKSSTDEPRGSKRKRGASADTDYQSNYNPKYLTSKELFELEVCVTYIINRYL